MRHYDLSKYDEFPGMDNIIVGNGELVAVSTQFGIGWITLCNTIIHNREDAVAYATRLDILISHNRQRVARHKVRFL